MTNLILQHVEHFKNKLEHYFYTKCTVPLAILGLQKLTWALKNANLRDEKFCDQKHIHSARCPCGLYKYHSPHLNNEEHFVKRMNIILGFGATSEHIVYDIPVISLTSLNS